MARGSTCQVEGLPVQKLSPKRAGRAQGVVRKGQARLPMAVETTPHEEPRS